MLRIGLCRVLHFRDIRLAFLISKDVRGHFGVSPRSVWAYLGGIWEYLGGHIGSIRRASRAIREHQGGVLRSLGGSPGPVFACFAIFEKHDIRKMNMRYISGP